jgi:hypothetical protein
VTRESTNRAPTPLLTSCKEAEERPGRIAQKCVKISCVLSVRCGIYNLSIDIYSMLNVVFVGSNKFVHIYIITRDLLNLLDMFRFHNPFVYCMFANTWGFKLILSLSRWFPVLGSGKIRCYMTCVEFAPWQQTNLRFMPFMLQMSFAQGTYTAVASCRRSRSYDAAWVVEQKCICSKQCP